MWVKIEVPEGYEIDKENSTFETIKFKEKSKLPMSWEGLGDITGYYIDSTSSLKNCYGYSCRGKENLWPTKELAEAALALSQLLQLRDRWNGDWKQEYGVPSFAILNRHDKLFRATIEDYNTPLVFKSNQLRDKFLETFKDLIETAKPLL